jgi:hypothetical protein
MDVSLNITLVGCFIGYKWNIHHKYYSYCQHSVNTDYVFPVFLSQWWTTPLRLQVSACSPFLMMCDVPRTAFFVENLLNVVLVLFPDILKLLLLFLITGFFSLVLLLLSQWWTPTLRLQVSDCNTFFMMCDVPSTAFFVDNLFNVVLVLFPNIFKPLINNFHAPSILCSTRVEFL